MKDREYFMTTSLSYQLKAARRELADFRSGEAYRKLRADYEGIIREQDLTIKKLRKERDGLSFSRKEITRQWMEVVEDVQKEGRKEVEKLKRTIAELLDIILSLKNRNAELDERRKKALKDYYEAASRLEEAQGLIVKLTAQANHNYENSSLPSSKCTDRKKITNNRERSGKRRGAQPGHAHHPRKPLEPDRIVEIGTEERFRDTSRYVPTGGTVTRQVIGIAVMPVVTQYQAEEFYDRKKGRTVHSAFPAGAADDVNYGESMKAVLFLLNSRCNVSLEKTARFVSDITDGALRPSVGMKAACAGNSPSRAGANRTGSSRHCLTRPSCMWTERRQGWTASTATSSYAATGGRPCTSQGRAKGMRRSRGRRWRPSAGS